jgi:MYXO-CTERM domain-containing protein
MEAPFRHLPLIAALGVVCAAIPTARADYFMYLDGVKASDTAPGTPEVWRWTVTPLDPSPGAGVPIPVGDFTGDGMDPATVALLLPAVQKVREAAARWPGTIPSDLSQPLSDTQIGLLLPAVQKVRAVGPSLPDPAAAPPLDFVTDLDPITVGLLLPAVQKVREAARRNLEVPGLPPPSDQDFFSLLLPAARDAADVAARVSMANLDLPRLLGLPGSGDSNFRFTTEWQLRSGRVTLRMDGAPIVVVPEPANWSLWLAGLVVAGLLRRRRGAPASAATA